MKEKLIEILEALGYPAFLQGSLNPEEEYPDSFFTFWNFSTPEAGFYDNDPIRAVWGFWIYFYSTDPALVEQIPEQARQALKAQDWIPDGKAIDVTVNRSTHTGKMFTVRKFENYEEV